MPQPRSVTDSTALPVFGMEANPYFTLFTAVLDCIVNQVDDRLLDQLHVDANLRIRFDFGHQPDSGLLGARLFELDRRGERQRQIAVHQIVPLARRAVFEQRQTQDILHEIVEPLGVG